MRSMLGTCYFPRNGLYILFLMNNIFKLLFIPFVMFPAKKRMFLLSLFMGFFYDLLIKRLVFEI